MVSCRSTTLWGYFRTRKSRKFLVRNIKIKTPVRIKTEINQSPKLVTVLSNSPRNSRLGVRVGDRGPKEKVVGTLRKTGTRKDIP